MPTTAAPCVDQLDARLTAARIGLQSDVERVAGIPGGEFDDLSDLIAQVLDTAADVSVGRLEGQLLLLAIDDTLQVCEGRPFLPPAVEQATRRLRYMRSALT